MKKPFKYILIILVLSALIFSYTQIQAQNAKEAQNPTKFNPQTFKAINVQRQNIQQTLTLAGSVDAEKKANLKFQTSGRLAWVGVKVGDKVKKFQAIAGLDQKELKKNLEKEFNDYRTGLSEFNDTQDTYKETKQRLLVTDEIQRILDRAQYSLNNNVISYELSDLAIKYSTLTTPISGVVTNVDQPLPGVNITAATATFTVIDPATVFLSAEIDQSNVPNVQVGKSATVQLDSFPDQTFNSEVSYIAFSPVIGETNTVYEIRFKLPVENQNLNYRLGMDGDASIILAESKNALTIPLEAIFESGNQKYVLTKNQENKIVKKNVQTGVENDTDVEILVGLSENDQVLIKQK